MGGSCLKRTWGDGIKSRPVNPMKTNQKQKLMCMLHGVAGTRKVDIR